MDASAEKEQPEVWHGKPPVSSFSLWVVILCSSRALFCRSYQSKRPIYCSGALVMC